MKVSIECSGPNEVATWQKFNDGSWVQIGVWMDSAEFSAAVHSGPALDALGHPVISHIEP